MSFVPISSLGPESLQAHAGSSIEAAVTLVWPYSSTNHHYALLLAEQDVNLRLDRGQIRVRFTGAAADALKDVGIADVLQLRLHGARWSAPSVRTPGRSVDGELVYSNYLEVSVRGAGQEQVREVKVDARPKHDNTLAAATTPRTPSQSETALSQTLESNVYFGSPTFATSRRYVPPSHKPDPFADDDSDDDDDALEIEASQRGAKRLRFSTVNEAASEDILPTSGLQDDELQRANNKRSPSPDLVLVEPLSSTAFRHDESTSAPQQDKQSTTMDQTIKSLFGFKDDGVALPQSSATPSQVAPVVPDLELAFGSITYTEEDLYSISDKSEPDDSVPSAPGAEPDLPLDQRDVALGGSHRMDIGEDTSGAPQEKPPSPTYTASASSSPSSDPPETTADPQHVEERPLATPMASTIAPSHPSSGSSIRAFFELKSGDRRQSSDKSTRTSLVSRASPSVRTSKLPTSRPAPQSVLSKLRFSTGAVEDVEEMEQAVLIEKGVPNLALPSIAWDEIVTSTKDGGMRTDDAYFTKLNTLTRYLNPTGYVSFGQDRVDVIAVVAEGSSQPARAKSGPRDYFTLFHVTDDSLLSQQKTAIDVLRPYKAYLPVTDVGDVVLLRAFAVKSRHRSPFLVSTDASAWCVWRYSQQSAIAAHSGQENRPARSERLADAVEEQVSGPMVEFHDQERQQVRHLRNWWLDQQHSSSVPDLTEHATVNDVASSSAVA